MVSSLANHWAVLQGFVTSAYADVETLSAAIAGILGVRNDEVGLLRLRGMSLEFVYPIALRSAGRIPLSSSAVAARTATYKKPEIFNDFFQVNHNSVFELVPLGGSRNNTDPRRIQKLISFPVLDSAHKAIGVIQISRKGRTPEEAGPDFTDQDLGNLDMVIQAISTAFEKL